MSKKQPIHKQVNHRYIGIDPGQSGGLVIIYPDELFGAGGLIETGIEATPMPSTEKDIWEWFASRNPKGVIATIEKVHSMPKQGVVSTFKFGTGYGGLRMALTAAGIPFEDVTPQDWHRGLGIPPRKRKPVKKRKKSSKKRKRQKVEYLETKAQFKNRLKAKTQQLFPSIKVTLKIADALLIAEYCRRKHQGLL